MCRPSIPRTPVSRTTMLFKERADGWTAGPGRDSVSAVPRTRAHLGSWNRLRARGPERSAADCGGRGARTSKASFTSSKAATACSFVTVGKSVRNSASDRPRSRYSNSVSTGTRVPANTGVPLRISGSTWMTWPPASSDSGYTAASEPKTGTRCVRTLKRGAEAPREILPIVSRQFKMWLRGGI